MIAFIDDHRQAHGVEPICRVLPIAPSTYHAHVAKRVDPSRLSARDKTGRCLKGGGPARVRGELPRLRRSQGLAAIAARGLRCPPLHGCTLMRAMGLEGIIRGKPIRTTMSDKAAPCPLDHVNRQFHAPAPNMLWVSDFTYVATWTGFVYVAFVIDTYARRIVGWRVTAADRRRVSGRFDDDHVLLRKLLGESLEKRPAHVNAPQSFELAVVPGDRLGEGAVDIQSNDPHGCSSVSVRSGRKLAGNTTSTDPRSRRIRESRKGRPCNELGLSAHCLSRACPHLRAPCAACPGWAHHIAVSLSETGGQQGADDLYRILA